MGLAGQEFLQKWEKYNKKINFGMYLEQHAYDSRNSDPTQTRIQLDTDSRTYFAYLKEMMLMIHKVRSDNNLEVLPQL